MPIQGAKYRMVKDKKGEEIRLAFVNGKVVEAKNMTTGAIHSPAEFAADARKSSARRRKA